MSLNKFLILCSLGICLISNQYVSAQETTDDEYYRPNFHFTPEKGWMNDPNGLFYLGGVYHLYFQHYPDDNIWGPMHWGHAISTDLVAWKEQAISLFPDEKGYIFSGSAIVDKANTSGFGKDGKIPVVAFFTYHDMKKEKSGAVDVETQGIAYSLDEGMTWHKYENNPVLDNPGIRDFRDPKVFWDTERDQWVMVLAAHDRIQFYKSLNLKDWSFLSEFGGGLGGHGGVWETPDLFPLAIKENGHQKWVLLVSINPGGINGGSATQYFVGDFDGMTFSMDERFARQLESEKIAWVDWGRDNYAGVTFNNIPDNKRITIGWMSNWDYAQDVPTTKWRSTSTIVREMQLSSTPQGYTLQSKPTEFLWKYLEKNTSKTILGSKKEKTLLKDIVLDSSQLNIDLKNLRKDGVYSFMLRNVKGERLIFGIDNKSRQLFINRDQSGIVDFKSNFALGNSISKFSKALKNAQLRILLDKTSIEVFLNDGERVMTEIFFPTVPYDQLDFESNDSTFNGEIDLYNIKLHTN